MKKTIVLAALLFTINAHAQTSIPPPVRANNETQKKDTTPPKIYYMFPLDHNDIANLFELIKNGALRLNLRPSEQDSILNIYSSRVAEYQVPKADTTKIKSKK